MRIGEGEYSDKIGRLNQYRSTFIFSLNSFAPEVSEDLLNDACPIFLDSDDRMKYAWGWEHLEDELKEALWQWGTKFNLTDEWMLEYAIEQLKIWTLPYSNVSPDPNFDNFARIDFGFLVDKLLLLRDKLQGYPEEFISPIIPFHAIDQINLPEMVVKVNALKETRSEAKSRVLKEIDQYFNSLKDKSRELDLEKNKQIRSKGFDRDDPYLHFRWLILYQIKGESFEKISEGKYKDDDWNKPLTPGTVRKAIVRLASEIGLTLRK